MIGKMKFITTSLLVIATALMLLTGCKAKEEPYVKFQDRMSMDWDSYQEHMLLCTAYKMSSRNATAEDYAYNILVVLNRMLSEDYPNTLDELCLIDLDGIEVLPNSVYEGMQMVKIDRWDETYGSTEFRRNK